MATPALARVGAALAVAFLLVSPAFAENCRNPTNLNEHLPPKEMRHEPFMPYELLDADAMDLKIFVMRSKKFQVLGHYDEDTGVISICRGLTGRALRIIRMHEEAHALFGWRH